MKINYDLLRLNSTPERPQPAPRKTTGQAHANDDRAEASEGQLKYYFIILGWFTLLLILRGEE
jgi:hypothetical protein